MSHVKFLTVCAAGSLTVDEVDALQDKAVVFAGLWFKTTNPQHEVYYPNENPRGVYAHTLIVDLCDISMERIEEDILPLLALGNVTLYLLQHK